MRKFVPYLLAAALLLSLATGCGREKKGKVIPRGKFAQIYAEMVLADEWLMSNSVNYKRMADTTYFYEPIFNKYGYTSRDYIASVEHYIDDPLRYGRILKKAEAIVRNREMQLQREYEASQGNANE